MKKILVLVSMFVMPFITFAAAMNSIWDIFSFVEAILNKLVPLFISLAVVWFIFNVGKYAIASEEDKKKEAKSSIIWGVAAIFIMISIWGLVNILQGSLGLGGAVAPSTGGLLPNF